MSTIYSLSLIKIINYCYLNPFKRQPLFLLCTRFEMFIICFVVIWHEDMTKFYDNLLPNITVKRNFKEKIITFFQHNFVRKKLKNLSIFIFTIINEKYHSNLMFKTSMIFSA
ncbi:hypothetical protein BpHYR1_000317 [Brachionus plicatilis]|uniref:Uncharacterized protein n=1 Tax=Brachionus plicatilis TaxID=10195 RepID=A0A3M7SHV0_BRAPC|nr:hypothetical protein BpHYR1_000317 [Brachionus plicatilis]